MWHDVYDDEDCHKAGSAPSIMMVDVWRINLLAILLLIGYFLLPSWGRRSWTAQKVGGRPIDRMNSKQKQQLKVAYSMNWINLGSDFRNHLLDTAHNGGSDGTVQPCRNQSG